MKNNRLFAQSMKKWVLSCSLVYAGSALLLAQNIQEKFTPPPPQRTVPPSRITRLSTPAALTPTVSAVEIPQVPDAAQLQALAIFPEPLVPITGADSVADRTALAAALSQWSQRKVGDDFSAIEHFVAQHPASGWTPSVWQNLGINYYTTGYFSKAMHAWRMAWEGAQSAETEGGKRIANKAAADYAGMLARTGRMEDLEQLLKDVSNRVFQGDALVQLERAKEGLWAMKNRPGIAFRCGPYALNLIYAQLQGATKEGFLNDPEVASPKEGFSMSRLREFAGAKLGLQMQVAKRSPGSELITPAVVHWNVNHFGALLETRSGQYLIKDPTFGNDTWMTQQAIDAESSGYFLVPAGPLPKGWSEVTSMEAATVFGKGHSGTSDPENTTPCDKQNGGNGCDGTGMATYSFHTMLTGLHVYDIPVGYQPGRGPAIQFQVDYNMKEAGQPTTMNYTNFSSQWENAWVSYLEDNPNSSDPNIPSSNVKIHLRGGGAETHSQYNAGTMTYGKNRRWNTILARIGSGHYERRHPDGSKEVYAHAIGTTGPNRKVFLSQVIDPQGNAVTLQYGVAPYTTRLEGVVDALGFVSTLRYQEAGSPYLVTEIEDPFGRKAYFTYNIVSGAKRLTKITDVVGIESSFNYNGSGQINALNTPYGKTTFKFGSPNVSYGLIRWIEATDPQGDRERIEYNLGTVQTGVPNVLPASEIPSVPGYSFLDSDMDDRNTFYWDRKAMHHAAGDYSKAHLYHWLQVDGADVGSGILESEKPAYEARVWYRYPGQLNSMNIGSSPQPILVVRKIENENGVVVNTWRQMDYNAAGNLTKKVDELGRETTYEYETNLLDLKYVKQKVGGVYQTIQTLGYDPAYPPHRPKTVTDAAGQTTTYTYNAQGQVLTVTNALSETITHTYETNPLLNGYGHVKLITGAQPGATTTYTYDAYQRVRTVTDSSGYTLTYDYDHLNRSTLVTHPDSTTEQFVYNRLDVSASKDREGRWTRTWHNALRQPIITLDPLGRMLQIEWCRCGALQRLIDGSGNLTRWQYDEQGRNIAKYYADGRFEVFTYEPRSGKLSTITDGKNQVKTYKYFIDGSLMGVTYTNATIATPSVAFTYDGNYPRRLLTMTDGTGVTSYAYYAVGSLGALQLSSSNGSLTGGTDLIAYTYDALGRRKTRNVGPAGTENLITWNYDSLGRTSSEVNNLGTFGYNYVAQTTRLSEVEYPNGQTTSFDYHPVAGDLRLKTISHVDGINFADSLSQFDYEYSPSGNITLWKKQSGFAPATRYQFGHDMVDQLISATLVDEASPTTVLHRQTYHYDPSGNRDSIQRDGVISQSVHNARNQLTGTTGGGKMLVEGHTDEPAKVTVNGQAAAVDAANRYRAWVDVTAGTNTITVNAEDYAAVSNTASEQWQVNIAGVGSQSFTYDENGNMLSDGLRIFHWDAENRLVKIVYASTLITEFTYDGLNRRTSVVEKDYSAATILHRELIWNAFDISEERDGSNNVVRRYYAQGEQKSAQSLFYTRDHLGSVREVTDSNGWLVNRYEYDPYGKVSRKGPFQLGNVGEGPKLASAVSKLSHALVGNRNLALALRGAPTLETRGDVSHLTLTFDEEVYGVSGVEIQGATTSGEVISGQTIEIPLQDVENGRLIIVKFAEVSGPSGTNYDLVMSFGKLFCDTNQDGCVNDLDIALASIFMMQPVTDENCRADVNRDGIINYIDFSAILGEFHQSIFTDRLYTGHFWHALSGLYLAPYRAYDPELGRWISEDPIQEMGGINLYGYVSNQPLRLIDILGLIGEQFEDPVDALKDALDWAYDNTKRGGLFGPEHGGFLYQDPDTGMYYCDGYKGTFDSVPQMVNPPDDALAGYHSHPWTPLYSEQFSFEDASWAWGHETDLWLITPSGKYRQFIPPPKSGRAPSSEKDGTVKEHGQTSVPFMHPANCQLQGP